MEEYIRDKEVSELVTKTKVTQKEYDLLKEDLEIAQIQLQEANDTLNGGITPRNMANFRNTYVINASDSLDATYPMYVYFRVLDETVKIVSVKTSYWIHNYRAYSKAAAAGGGQTTSSGGGQTSSSGGGQITSGTATQSGDASSYSRYDVLLEASLAAHEGGFYFDEYQQKTILMPQLMAYLRKTLIL